MKSSGKVRHIGITHYTASAYGAVERELKANPWDFLQINYSLGERDAEKRILPLATERRVAVIINRPFQEGVLFQRTKNRALPAWAKEYEINSWAQYFLKWIVSHPAVTCAIPGTGRPDHMRDNLGAGHGVMLDEKGRQRLAEYFDAL
jgi:aryl-alcohol dehydrogenase-like predicted oxidoreductase